MRLFVLLLLVQCALCSYFGNTHGGCQAHSTASNGFYNAPNNAELEWWTVSFTDGAKQIGGQVTILHGSLKINAVQIGITVGNQVFSYNDIHFNRWTKTTNTSFCVGAEASGACLEVLLSKNQVVLAGQSKDKAIAFEITLQGSSDRWCLLDNAVKQVSNFRTNLNWWHYIPGGTISGTIGLKNGTRYSVAGVGQNDHFWIHKAINPLTVVSHLIDGHFYNASTGTNIYWGSNPSHFRFLMLEAPSLHIPTQIFWGTDDVTFNVSYVATTSRPNFVEVKADNGAYIVKLLYSIVDRSVKYGSGDPIEDIVYMSGTVSTVSGIQHEISGFGWGQLLGGKINTKK